MFFFMYALILVFLFFSSMKVKNEVEVDSVCMRIQNIAINGSFILFVMMGHLSSYTENFPFLDSISIKFVRLVGQYVVSPFLFFIDFCIVSLFGKDEGMNARLESLFEMTGTRGSFFKNDFDVLDNTYEMTYRPFKPAILSVLEKYHE